MIEKEVVNITDDEAALYDRQIRLWGLDAQKRLRAARVLLIGVGGLGAEVAKNIVLAGVKSVTLLDAAEVTVRDSCCQFLVNRSDIGQNRALCSLDRTQQLNPMVQVKVDTECSVNKTEEYFASFDVICATCCTLSELLRIDEICQRLNVAFFAGDVFGYYGYMFANLHEHEYAEDIVSHTAVKSDTHGHGGAEPPAKKHCPEDDIHKTVKKLSSFSPLRNVLNIDWSIEPNSTKLKKTPKTYFIVRVLLEFRTREGHDPEGSQDDCDKLKVIAADVWKSLGVPEDWIDEDFYSQCAMALSPVCAITGGILAQEVIKAVSQRDAPHNNFFLYNGVDSSGLVDKITG
jgi:ubiquitin-like 1-activating enzyme E1 A